MLMDQEWLSAWLKEHILAADRLPEHDVIEQLLQLRSLLWNAVQRIVEKQSPDQDLLEQLNAYMAKGPVIRQITWNQVDEHHEVTLLPLYFTWEQVIAEIASSFATAVYAKETSRFRICENPHCLWVYYDDTRNRSKRYCDDKACGNLIKVRRFRARKKAELEGRE